MCMDDILNDSTIIIELKCWKQEAAYFKQE